MSKKGAYDKPNKRILFKQELKILMKNAQTPPKVSEKLLCSKGETSHKLEENKK